MKSLKLINGNLEIINAQKPVLEGLGAIIKVIGCGLCGSDIVKIREKDDNAILGHEVVGEIVEINTKTNFKKGDIVVISHHYPCGTCEYCIRKSYSMCRFFKSTNLFPCGFSEYLFASEGHLEHTTFKVPNGFKYDHIAFVEPLACCIRAVERADLINVANTLTLGLGSIGLLMAQASKNCGYNSYGFDVDSARQEQALNYGIKFDENIKYDAIFMTSGSHLAIPTALKYVRDGGKIIVFSSVKGDFGYTNNDIYYRELSVIASYSPSVDNLKTSYKMITQGKINLDNISTTYKFDDITSALCDTVNGKIYKAYIEL